MPLSLWQASDRSLAMTSPTLNLKPEMIALISTSLVRSTGSNEFIDAWQVVWQLQNIVDGYRVGRHSPASNVIDCFLPLGIMGVEFSGPVEICSSGLSAEMEPVEVGEPLVNDGLQFVILQAVIEKEALFLPSVFGSKYSLVAFFGSCSVEA
ncbi:hypothetical protein V6N11_033811 [Hibiscus sabdariffa]|uniref:Uncharacterized protein n=1 Tax=Hibiscus sabdariffa TaxID=183260 RepID=A0ABR2S0T2_9ROSI